MDIIVQHKVGDYDTWKRAFDDHAEVRRRHGSSGHRLYRGADDPNDITVIVSFPSREQAEAFAGDPSLREAMEQGGVLSQPTVTWLEQVESADYQALAA